MPKKIMVTDHDMQWLRDNHKNYRYPELADKIGVCTDTLKRILVREGLQDFAGAKYQVSRASKANQKWARPCMRCKSIRPRPKWQYICDKCKSHDSYDPWLD
jgi:hypothetical protein